MPTRQLDRILVIRSGAMGDFIVTLPVIHLLRNTYPSCRLALVARNRFRCLVMNVVNEFRDIDGPLLLPFFQEQVDENCEEYRYVAAFDLVVSYLGGDAKVSRNLRSLRLPRVINAPAVPPESYDRHITEFLLQPLAELVDVSSPPLPSVAFGEEEASAAEKFLVSRGIDRSSRVVAVHPGSGSRPKVTPAGNFCLAVNRIRGRYPGLKTLVLEGEADEQDVLAFERCLKAPCIRVSKENLLEVAAIVSRASLFIGNDSGISHLAAAVGVPTIVVFRESNPAVWAPRGKQVWLANDDSLPATAEQAAEVTLGPKLA